MYITYENEGFNLSLNETFLNQHFGKEFLDIGIQRSEVGKIERDNISIEISYDGFGNLKHKGTGQTYDNIRFTTEQWEKVKAHFRANPHLYEYYHWNMLVRIYEAGIPKKMTELVTNTLDFSVEQMLIRLYVQHVACKSSEELAAIRDKKVLTFRSGIPISIGF